jgi:N-methylhydantoinase B/oxoprolinase/acetone carboxylase alpha subunit
VADAGVYFCDDACHRAHREGSTGHGLAEAFAPKLATDCYDDVDGIDPITLEVFNGALLSACKEMARTMERTAYSPVFSEGADLTTALFDTDFNLIAQYEGIPAQMGSMKYGVVGAIAEIGDENLVEGDVVLHNDSYRGTPHAPEFCMVMPVFWDGAIVAYAANIAHHTDVGGKAPGSMPGDATEIFQEGVIIPPVKVIKAGQEDPELWRVYLANVRTPEQSYGDSMAMYASILVAQRRVHELLDRYGRATFDTYAKEVRRVAERRMRAGLRDIPNGVYRGTAVLEDDGVSDQPYEIQLELVVLDEDLIFDFRGSSAQARGPVNSPYGVSLGACANALFNLVDPHISHNEGTFAPIHPILPPGSVVNCNFPAPLNGGNTESHNITLESVMSALAHAIPDRVAAACGSTTCLITGGGSTPDGERFTYIVWEGSGWGGMDDLDGETSITAWVGVGSKTFPAEVLESKYPWRVVRHELRSDPGAGRHRGGLGCEAEYEILTDDFEVSSISCRGRIAPEGRFGGDPGQIAEVRVVRDGEELVARDLQPNLICPTKFSGLRLRTGDRLIVRSPGGGGYGPPSERDPSLVERDLELGYVTHDGAPAYRSGGTA